MGSFRKLVPSCQGIKSFFRTRTAFGSGNIREFSGCPRSAPPETCVMMGRHGEIVYPGTRWMNLDDYLATTPILNDVPIDRIFGTPDRGQPYMVNDMSCGLMKSGLYLPYFCQLLGKSCSGVYTRDNVGVIADLGMLAYRNLEQDVGQNWMSNLSAGYNEYSTFMKSIISEHHPRSLNLLPTGLVHLFHCLDDPEVEIEFVLDHPVLLSDEKYGSMLIKVARLLRNEYRVFGRPSTAKEILKLIYPSQYDCVTVCQEHPVLNEYLPSSLKNTQFTFDDVIDNLDVDPEIKSKCATSVRSIGMLACSELKSGTGGPGTPVYMPTPYAVDDFRISTAIILVDVNRHGSVHSVEYHLLPLLQFLPGQCANSLELAPYTRKEMIQFLRYKFPKYLPQAYLVFRAMLEWNTLDARSLDPIPSIYFAPGRC